MALIRCLPGYSGFHPPHPGQDEDILSDANVKNGFVLGHPVSVSLSNSALRLFSY